MTTTDMPVESAIAPVTPQPTLLQEIVDIFNIDDFLLDRGISTAKAKKFVQKQGVEGTYDFLARKTDSDNIAEIMDALDVDPYELGMFMNDLTDREIEKVANFFSSTPEDIYEFLNDNQFFDFLI